MAPKKQAKVSKSAAKAKSSSLPSVPLGDDLVTSELKYGKGEKREYVITTPSKQLQEARNKRSFPETVAIGVLLVVSLVARLYKLSDPDSVVFDEVHFGGFARKYILGAYFMDVHPPLAKMLFAGFGFLFGYNGDFEFAKIGDVFTESVPYTMMRAFSALCGVGTIFTLYSTLRLSGCKPVISFFTSSLLLIENANFTISRYILLDSPLIFFISCAVYSIKRSELDTPFTFNWYKSLTATGVSLGLALSSKWVGLFTVAWIGLVTVWNLWFVLGDISVKPRDLIKQTIFKLFFFLAIPITLYLYFFSIHYQILDKEGDGSAFMSAPFRSSLKGNRLPSNIKADVGVGSKVTIRHLNTAGGYLHSHNHLYETGSKQQQVTLYPHLDENNVFQIELYNVSEYPTEFVPITHGTKIRLLHTQTKRRIHSHDHKPPVSESADWQKEVSAYGFEGFEGDPNDDFIVEIVARKSVRGEPQSRVRALQTVFRLHHAMTGCYLFSHETKLPSWAFEQQEVTCATQGIESLSLWYVEENENEFLPEDADRISYRAPTFFEKVLESHRVMWKINQGLTDSHNWESTPDSWPLLLRGINYWVKDNTQIYLFGNIITWWATTAAIVGFGVYVAIQLLRWQRGANVASSPAVFNFNVQTFQFIVGWGIHYVPSFLMGRQLFLHHYLPAFYFAMLSLGHTLEIIHSHVLKNRRYISYGVLLAFFASALAAFYVYSPLIKGDPWTKQACQSSKLLSSWDFDCNAFLDSPSAYESNSHAINQAYETPSINFEEAKPVRQDPNFEQPQQQAQQAQEPLIAVEEAAIPESEENAASEAPVQVEATDEGSGQSDLETSEDSTGAEPNVSLDTEEKTEETPTGRKLHPRDFAESLQDKEDIESFLHEQAASMMTTGVAPREPVKNNFIVKREGKYYDSDDNELGEEAAASAHSVTANFPMDKMVMKQKRRSGDVARTVY